jgi:hypothetical protein
MSHRAPNREVKGVKDVKAIPHYPEIRGRVWGEPGIGFTRFTRFTGTRPATPARAEAAE